MSDERKEEAVEVARWADVGLDLYHRMDEEIRSGVEVAELPVGLVCDILFALTAKAMAVCTLEIVGASSRHAKLHQLTDELKPVIRDHVVDTCVELAKEHLGDYMTSETEADLLRFKELFDE
jgi:hypothetical protein